jgi:hypothetical protein
MRRAALLLAVLSIVPAVHAQEAPALALVTLPEFSGPPDGAPDTTGWAIFQAEGVIQTRNVPAAVEKKVPLLSFLADKKVCDATVATCDFSVRVKQQSLVADGKFVKAVLHVAFRGPSGTLIEVFDIGTGMKLADHRYWVRAGGTWTEVTDEAARQAVYDAMNQFVGVADQLIDRGILKVVE